MKHPVSSIETFHAMGYETKQTLFSLEQFCFDKQLNFVTDQSKFKVACNSRRAGKTIACAADLIMTCLTNPGTTSLYIALSRLNAKMILWDELIGICRTYKLGVEANISELMVRFPNGASILLSGASDESEINKFLGKPFKKVYIDEAQSFPDFLRKLIFSVLTPSLYDYNGSLSLIGTPAARRHGIFYEAFSGQEGFKEWKRFHWTLFDNPHIKRKSGREPRDIIEEDIRIQGLSWEHPTIRRNAYGEWAEDDSALVYAFNRSLNTYESLPEINYEYVLGLDFGFEDADAAVLWAYSRSLDQLFLIEEGQRKKQTISELAEWIKQFQSRYNISKIVGDTGGLGKKIVEEIYQRHGIHVHAAEKSRKREFIELMNSDFRTGKILIPKDASICEDWSKLEWDTSTFPYKEDSRLHCYTHRPDAGLYAYREAKHWAYSPPVEKVHKRPDEWVQEYWEDKGDDMRNKKAPEWWENIHV